MDISKASNFERFIWDALGQDGARTAALWRQLEQTGSFDLAGSPEWAQIKTWGVVSGASSHALRLSTIREVAARYGTVIDPHTADGVAVAQRWREPGVPMICLETALPAKFGDTLREALGTDPARPPGFEGLEARVQRFIRMPADLRLLKSLIAQRVAAHPQ
jgi:threonine synthase